MDPKNNSESSEESAFTKAPIPPNAKRVREVRTEIYTEPIIPPSSSDVAEGVKVADCPYCLMAVLNTEDIEQTPNGLAHADCAEEDRGKDAAPAPPLSPADRFLSSLKVDEGRGSQLRIYVYREPDPIGAQFRNQYSGPRKSVGPLEYDLTFDSAAAVEAYVQRLHRGGSYYFEVREAGKYATSWSRLIDDPPITEPKPEAAATTIAPGVQGSSSSEIAKAYLQEMADSVTAIRKITGADNSHRSQESPPPPPDPFGDMGRALVLDLTKKALENATNPPTVTTSDREPTTTENVITFARELGIAEIIREGMKQIGIPLLAQAIRNRQMQPPNGGTPSVGAPTPNPTPQAAEPPAPATEQPLAAMGDPFAPQAIPAEAIDFVLRPVVADMMADVAAGRDDFDVSRSVEALVSVANLHEEAAQFLQANILPKSGVRLLGWLGEVNIEWRLLADTDAATDYAGWLNELRLDLREAMSAADGSSEVLADVSREASPRASAEILDFEIAPTAPSHQFVPQGGDPSLCGICGFDRLNFTAHPDNRPDSAAGVGPSDRDEADSQDVTAVTLESAPAADVSRETIAAKVQGAKSGKTKAK